MDKTIKICVFGANGLVGRSVVKKLKESGYLDILTPSSREVDLRDDNAVDEFILMHTDLDFVILCAAKVGGIEANSEQPADFIFNNITIQSNVIDSCATYGIQNLIFLGSSCFTEGQLVFTTEGYKSIETIEIGDKVLSHTNNFCPVVNVAKRNANGLVAVDSVGNEQIVCTPEHKFLTKDRSWVEASDLNQTDYLMVSKKFNIPTNNTIELFVDKQEEQIYLDCNEFINQCRKPKSPREYRWFRKSYPRSMIFKSHIYNSEAENSMSYLIGAYLAEGYLAYKPTKQRDSTYTLSLSPGFDNEFIKNIETALTSLTKTRCHRVTKLRTSTRIDINSKHLCQFFIQFYTKDGSHHAHNKKIPPFIFNLSRNALKEIIRGYWDGDGCIYKRPDRINQFTCVCASTSKHLMYGIRRILLQLGIFASVSFVKKPSTCVIEGRTVNQKSQYTLRVNGSNAIKMLNDIFDYGLTQNKPKDKIISDDKYYYCKVQKITPLLEQNKDVYDLTVDQSHSYNVGDVIVHNCIYPRNCPQPMKESDLLSGQLESTNEAYAIAKICGIEMCWAYNKQYDTKFLPIMPTNIYGENDHFNPTTSHVIPALIYKFHQAVINGIDIVEIWGTGKPRREFLHADDLGDAIRFLIENYQSINFENKPLYNIGTGHDISIAELVHLLQEFSGIKSVVFNHDKPDGTMLKRLDTTKMRLFGWKSSIHFIDGLKKVWENYMERNK